MDERLVHYAKSYMIIVKIVRSSASAKKPSIVFKHNRWFFVHQKIVKKETKLSNEKIIKLTS